MQRILEHKIKIPSPHNYFVRKRLYSYLDKHSSASLFLINCDAGYGKTSLVSGYVRHKKVPAVWYHLDADDQEAHIFLSYLKTAILRITSNNEMNLIVNREEIESEFQDLLSILTNWSDLLFIVIDNCQHIESNNKIHQMLDQLLQYSSSSITFILIGQTRIKRIPVQLKLNRRVIEINKEHLSFTKTETEQYLRHLHGIQQNHEITAVHEKTEGWITGIQFYLQSIQDMEDRTHSDAIMNFPGIHDIHDYFTFHVMARLPEDLKIFLYKTSLLTELDLSVINQFLAIPNSEKIIDGLLTRGVFLSKDEQGVLCYHPMFQSYLYEEFQDILKDSDQDISDHHIKIAKVYKDKCMFFPSFVHYVAGEDYYQAAQLVRNMELRYNPDKFLILILNWLDGIYAHDKMPFDSVFLFRCIPLAILDQLILPIEKYMKILEEKENLLQLCHLQYCLATIYRHKGEFEKAKCFYLTSLDYSEKWNIHSSTVLNLVGLSEVYLNSGLFHEAEKKARQALFLSERYQITHCQIYALWFLAEIHLQQNKADTALPFLEQLKTLLDHAIEYDARSVYLYYSLSRLKALQKDYAQSLEFAEKGMRDANKFGNDLDLGGSYFQLGQTYIQMKNWDKAEEYLNLAVKELEYFTFYRCLAKSKLVNLFELKGDYKAANEMRNDLLNICRINQYHYLSEQINLTQRCIVISNIPMVPPLSIKVLGDFKVTLDGKPVIIKRKSSLKMLQLLIVNRQKKLQKDYMLDTLFPEVTFESINNHFYVSLSTLRKVLEPELNSGRNSRYISQIDDHYILKSEHLYLDVDEFLSLSDNNSNSLSKIPIEKLLKAESLYKGNLFEEYPYEPFIEKERERIRAKHLTILRTLAHYNWSINDFTNGIEYFEKILAIDPYQELIYIEYIKKLLENNLFIQAKNVAERNIKFVEKELGINVSTKINEIFHPYSFSM
ncbi:hypothetical protein LIT32_07260 [Bacillus sp. CMF21]|nr:hypothetical protein LIT32_07260 [Bacillus sp. CMF21]